MYELKVQTFQNSKNVTHILYDTEKLLQSAYM